MEKVKKHRGQKRYYKNLASKNDDLINDLAKPLSNSHFHFDKKGLGNYSFKKRRPHLNKLFRHFDLLEEKVKGLKSDFQLYTIILDYSSESDALFFNTFGEEYNKLTFKISDLQSDSTLTNEPLKTYINELNHYEKLYGHADEAFCLIYKKNIGQAFL